VFVNVANVGKPNATKGVKNMNSIFTILCALLVGVVLSNSALAHEATTDSVEPVELGSVFQFPAKEQGVTRLVCTEAKYLDIALEDLRGLRSARKAHHFLFHDSERTLTKKGTERFKSGGYSLKTMKMLKKHCQGLRSKFAPVEVIKEMDIHGYKVSIVSIYESYSDKEGVFYTWFVNTQILQPAYPFIKQRVIGKDYLRIGGSARIPKGMLAFTSLDLVQEIFSSASEQPEVVGRKVLQFPMKSFMSYKTRIRFKEEQDRGWIQTTGYDSNVVFSEFVESRQIHGLNVSILAFDIPSSPSGKPYRLYTWVVDIEIIEPKSKK
jgi:hypothetical protein